MINLKITKFLNISIFDLLYVQSNLFLEGDMNSDFKLPIGQRGCRICCKGNEVTADALPQVIM